MPLTVGVCGSLTSYFKPLLDLVYPPKCALCGEIDSPAICPSCSSEIVLLEGSRHDVGNLAEAIYLFNYDGRASQAVKRLKYECATSLAEPMSSLLSVSAEKLKLLDVDSIVPVPIHWTRRYHRGFNQAELLCEGLPSRLVNRRLLRRIRATRPQVGLSGEERSRNIQNAFEASPEVQGKRILLVDDVLTTGNTANECARTLLAAGAAEVKGLFFAGEDIRKGAAV